MYRKQHQREWSTVNINTKQFFTQQVPFNPILIQNKVKQSPMNTQITHRDNRLFSNQQQYYENRSQSPIQPNPFIQKNNQSYYLSPIGRKAFDLSQSGNTSQNNSQIRSPSQQTSQIGFQKCFTTCTTPIQLQPSIYLVKSSSIQNKETTNIQKRLIFEKSKQFESRQNSTEDSQMSSVISDRKSFIQKQNKIDEQKKRAKWFTSQISQKPIFPLDSSRINTPNKIRQKNSYYQKNFSDSVKQPTPQFEKHKTREKNPQRELSTQDEQQPVTFETTLGNEIMGATSKTVDSSNYEASQTYTIHLAIQKVFQNISINSQDISIMEKSASLTSDNHVASKDDSSYDEYLVQLDSVNQSPKRREQIANQITNCTKEIQAHQEVVKKSIGIQAFESVSLKPKNLRKNIKLNLNNVDLQGNHPLMEAVKKIKQIKQRSKERSVFQGINSVNSSKMNPVNIDDDAPKSFYLDLAQGEPLDVIKQIKLSEQQIRGREEKQFRIILTSIQCYELSSNKQKSSSKYTCQKNQQQYQISQFHQGFLQYKKNKENMQQN